MAAILEIILAQFSGQQDYGKWAPRLGNQPNRRATRSKLEVQRKWVQRKVRYVLIECEAVATNRADIGS